MSMGQGAHGGGGGGRGSRVSGGDFVRNVKLLIDLLRQLGDRAPNKRTADVARATAERLARGVVAASSDPSRSPTITTGPPT